MKIKKENLKDPDWSKYKVNQLDFYSNAERNDLICRCVLMQIYQDFYFARENLLFSDERKNYGDLVDDDIKNRECVQKMFVQNALLYYNFCVDLSWVMVYYYCLPKTRDNISITKKDILKAEEVVCYDFVKENLEYYSTLSNGNLKNNLNLLLEYIEDFWNSICNNSGFRTIYNYIKHKGAYDIIGIAPEKFFSIEGIKTNIEIMEFKDFDIDKMTDSCIKFNNDFVEYMEKIIKIVINP